MPLSLSLPLLPPSTNQSLMAVRGRLIHTSKAREFRALATQALTDQLEGLDLSWLVGARVRLEVEYRSKRWTIKSGAMAKRDIANLEKLLVDSLSEALNTVVEFDDRQIWELHLRKAVGEDQTTLVLSLTEWHPQETME